MSGNQPYEFENIPDELTSLVQWLVWKYELKEGGLDPLLPTSWTKVPYQVRNARMKCDPTNPSHLAPFNEAVALYERHELEFSGIGFAILGTEKPRITCIDLDQTDDETVRAFQTQIYDWFSNTYAEISPSGQGCHLWAYGEAPSGRRKGIEMYSQERYITMTGWTCRYRNLPLASYDEDIKSFRESMNKEISGERGKGYNEPQREDDATIYNRALSAHNGVTFKALWDGDWQSRYASQSEADLALTNILAFYTQNREQIARLFFASALGQREKIRKRPELMNDNIDKAFDRLPPIVDYEAMTNSLNAIRAEYIARQNASSAEVKTVSDIKETDPYVRPPGLLGDIAEYVYNQSPYPVKEFALSAAIGLMCGICGREYNINGAGLNLYILNVAGSGTGKESINIGVSKLISMVRMQVPDAPLFIGPKRIASAPGLDSHIRRKGASLSIISIMGEFGYALADMIKGRSDNQVALKARILDLYNKSGRGNTDFGSAYSSADKKAENLAEPIESLTFSLLGETTPNTLFENFDEKSISDGLVPRFLLIEYKDFSLDYNQYASMVQPSQNLIDNLSRLMNQVLSYQRSQTGRQVIDVDTSPEAHKMLEEYRIGIRKTMHTYHYEGNEAHKNLLNRAHIKVLKLAALCAVGQNFAYPTISEFDAQWAINIVDRDVGLMLSKLNSGEIGNVTSASLALNQEKAVKKVIKDATLNKNKELLVKKYPVIKQAHVDNNFLPISYVRMRALRMGAFQRETNGAERRFYDIINQLEKDGFISIERVTKDGHPLPFGKPGHAASCIFVRDLDSLIKGE